MNRRTFICVFGGSVIAAPFAGQAQPASKTPRVGYVSSNRRLATADAFEQGLRELGYRIGENIRIEYRFGEGRVDRIPVFVDEVLRLRVDVLFAANPYVIREELVAGSESCCRTP